LRAHFDAASYGNSINLSVGAKRDVDEISQRAVGASCLSASTNVNGDSDFATISFVVQMVTLEQG
jgi:hypothetical protein